MVSRRSGMRISGWLAASRRRHSALPSVPSTVVSIDMDSSVERRFLKPAISEPYQPTVQVNRGAAYTKSSPGMSRKSSWFRVQMAAS